MSDTRVFEERIEAALGRIDESLDKLGSAEAAAEAAGLRAELEDERLANAQLTERVKAIRERQETTVAELESKVRRLGRTVATQEAMLARLRQTNDALRENNSALRDANAEGVGNADLINDALRLELEALRTAAAADRAELDEILGSIGPLVAGANDA